MIDSLSTNTYRVIVTVLYRFACNIKIGLDYNTRLSSILFRRTIQTLQRHERTAGACGPTILLYFAGSKLLEYFTNNLFANTRLPLEHHGGNVKRFP